jgi:hypothetical protein
MAPLRDIAVILLALEAMVLMLVPAAVIGASLYGVRWLRRKLPPLFAQARKILALVRLYVERTGAAIVAPLITIYAVAAQIRATWTSLISLVREEN